MLNAALIALVVLGQAPEDDDRCRARQCRAGRVDPASLASYAFFEFAPASGAGMTAPCACATPTGAKGEAVTIGRTTEAWCIKGDFTHVKCSANQARVMPGRVDETWLGLASESQRQNLLASGTTRDLSNAAWTKSNMTCTKTATGLDGVSSSASTCAASASNGTVTQCVTAGSAAHAVSIHIKRRTGTGAVSVSMDGSTWYAITSAVNSTWRRAVPSESIGCAGGRCIDVLDLQATVANPCIAVKLATSGDAVDLDMAQVEAGGYSSTPIDVNGTNLGYRTQDLPYATISFPTGGGYSFSLTAVATMNIVSNPLGEPYSGATTFSSGYTGGTTWSCNYILSGAGPTGTATGDVLLKLPTPMACAWDGTSVATAYYDSQSGTGTSAKAGYTATRFYLGASGANSTSGDVVVRGVCLDVGQTRCNANALASHASQSLAYIGDSISAGQVVSYKPVVRVGELLGTDWHIVDSAVGGSKTADGLSRWTSTVRAQSPSVVTVMLGVNDAIGAVSHSTAWSNLETILNEARSDGARVIPQYVLTCDGGSGCDATAQQLIVALNTDLTNWCADAGASCLDMRSTFEVNGALSTTYNYGDQIHLNDLGSKILTQAVHDAVSP